MRQGRNAYASGRLSTHDFAQLHLILPRGPSWLESHIPNPNVSQTSPESLLTHDAVEVEPLIMPRLWTSLTGLLA